MSKKPVKLDGVVLDIPDAERCFHRFTHLDRADMMASHRLGWRQKQRVGEVFWTHELCGNIAFRTRKDALRATLRSLSVLPPAEERDNG